MFPACITKFGSVATLSLVSIICGLMLPACADSVTSQFEAAIRSGNCDKVTKILGTHPSLASSLLQDGDAPLRIAVAKKDDCLVSALTPISGAVLLDGKDDLCALHEAIDQGDLQLLTKLLDDVTIPEARAYDGPLPPLHAAAAARNPLAVSLLIKHGFSRNARARGIYGSITSVTMACTVGDYGTVISMISAESPESINSATLQEAMTAAVGEARQHPTSDDLRKIVLLLQSEIAKRR